MTTTGDPDRVRFSGDHDATTAPLIVRGVPCKCEAPVLAPAADAGPEIVCQRCGGTVRMANPP